MSWLRKFFNKVFIEPVLDVFSFIGVGPDRPASAPTPAALPEPTPPVASGLYTDAQVRAFSTHDINTLGSSALNSLNTAQFGLLSSLQITALTATQIGSLETADLHALSSAQITALSGPQVQALLPQQVGALASAQVVGLEARDIEVMTTAQIAAFSNDSLRAMTSVQLDAVFLAARTVDAGVARPSAVAPDWADVLVPAPGLLLPGGPTEAPADMPSASLVFLDKRLPLDDEVRCVPLI